MVQLSDEAVTELPDVLATLPGWSGIGRLGPGKKINKAPSMTHVPCVLVFDLDDTLIHEGWICEDAPQLPAHLSTERILRHSITQ